MSPVRHDTYMALVHACAMAIAHAWTTEGGFFEATIDFYILLEIFESILIYFWGSQAILMVLAV